MNLPTLLAGPILRRTERSRVCIWLATRAPYHVRADIYHHDKKIASGQTLSIRLGKRLHIALVEVRPDTPFPVDTVLTYDIRLLRTLRHKKGVGLKELGLLDGPHRITYGELRLPSFFLPGKRTPLQILHGSCRKLHGKGEDALAAVDDVLAAHPTDLRERPSALFLTGDQIYADDVSPDLTEHVTALGAHLMGWEEQIPGLNRRLSAIPPGGRREFLKTEAHLTSLHAENHVMSFGEYCALYLLAWNAQNWPDPATSPRWTMDEHLRRTYATLPAVRRALANIPTYMIFDDHDVTDDWNLTGSWHLHVHQSQAGRRLLANGLAAYWAFQGFGNNPDAFDETDFQQPLQRYLTQNGQATPRMADAYEQTLLDFREWSYHAPTAPPAIVLDTRTRRAYDSSQGPARLLNAAGLVQLAALTRKAGHQPGKPLLLVSPTPVYGYQPVEMLQSALTPLTGPYRIDSEAWRANAHGYADLLRTLRIIRPEPCFILSGDAHYAFTAIREERDLQLIQLTASPLKNTGPKSLILAQTSPLLQRLLEGGFLQTVGYGTSPLLGDNNIGRVTLDGTDLQHRHYVRTTRATRSTAASYQIKKR